jgi:hypothetical protein
VTDWIHLAKGNFKNSDPIDGNVHDDSENAGIFSSLFVKFSFRD